MTSRPRLIITPMRLLIFPLPRRNHVNHVTSALLESYDRVQLKLPTLCCTPASALAFITCFVSSENVVHSRRLP